MNLYNIRLYPRYSHNGDVIKFENIPAKDQHEAREKGKEFARRLEIETDSDPYIDFIGKKT